MINKNIINAVIAASSKESKDLIINELLNHISLNYDYNDNKAGHLLEMLVDPKTVISTKDVNIDYINKNPSLLIYNHNKYNIKNIKIINVDNIDGIVKVEYEYLEKVNEDKVDVSYNKTYVNISFIDNTNILNK